MYQGLANFFHREAGNKYFRFSVHVVSVLSTQLCHSSRADVDNTEINKHGYVLIKIYKNRQRPDLAYRL